METNPIVLQLKQQEQHRVRALITANISCKQCKYFKEKREFCSLKKKSVHHYNICYKHSSAPASTSNL